jgi:ubiquinone/menaquinone biosynthesis C-methylase UbiE
MDNLSNREVLLNPYFQKYDSVKRFISYFHQADSILKLNPSSVLEIGIGNETVSDYIKKRGIRVVTCDFNPDRHPDIVADIRKLPFRENQFDLVAAFEVLEHIPFSDFEKALGELKRVAKKHVVISIPRSIFFFEIIFNISIPHVCKIYSILLYFPLFFRKIIFKGNKKIGHHWEIGTRGYPKGKIVKIINKYFKIKRIFNPYLNQIHCFFILDK